MPILLDDRRRGILSGATLVLRRDLDRFQDIHKQALLEETARARKRWRMLKQLRESMSRRTTTRKFVRHLAEAAKVRTRIPGGMSRDLIERDAWAAFLSREIGRDEFSESMQHGAFSSMERFRNAGVINWVDVLVMLHMFESSSSIVSCLDIYQRHLQVALDRATAVRLFQIVSPTTAAYNVLQRRYKDELLMHIDGEMRRGGGSTVRGHGDGVGFAAVPAAAFERAIRYAPGLVLEWGKARAALVSGRL